MNVATKTRLDVVRLSPHIGAEVRHIDLRGTLDSDTIEAIRQAWLDHAVILFRNQDLSQEDLPEAGDNTSGGNSTTPQKR